MATDSSLDRSPSGRVLVVVSRFNEAVTRRLMEGATTALTDAGYSDDRVDVFWVPGAWELPVVVRRALDTKAYRAAVALGAVIRGETPHFDYICAEVARGLATAAQETGIPVGFGLLTCETLAQAMARAGGEAGNKGAEAAVAALETADRLDQVDGRAAT
jgi:6,7-dimethyl-8-ribityllumazine synthase